MKINQSIENLGGEQISSQTFNYLLDQYVIAVKSEVNQFDLDSIYREARNYPEHQVIVIVEQAPESLLVDFASRRSMVLMTVEQFEQEYGCKSLNDEANPPTPEIVTQVESQTDFESDLSSQAKGYDQTADVLANLANQKAAKERTGTSSQKTSEFKKTFGTGNKIEFTKTVNTRKTTKYTETPVASNNKVTDEQTKKSNGSLAILIFLLIVILYELALLTS